MLTVPTQGQWQVQALVLEMRQFSRLHHPFPTGPQDHYCSLCPRLPILPMVPEDLNIISVKSANFLSHYFDRFY